MIENNKTYTRALVFSSAMDNYLDIINQIVNNNIYSPDYRIEFFSDTIVITPNGVELDDVGKDRIINNGKNQRNFSLIDLVEPVEIN